MARPIRTVVVDDQRAFLGIASDVIAATEGFERAGEATSGLDGLAVVEREAPDLAIVDVHMPGMSGVEVARRIKADHPSVVVALVSAELPSALPETAHASGADHVLCKQEFGSGALRRIAARCR